MRYIMAILMVTLGGHANAHQWLPTYPELRQSYIQNVLVTTLELFNVRKDVEYYEISVLDEDMNPVKFATPEKIINVKHLKKKSVDVYIRKRDKDKAVYVCSSSKLLKQESSATVIASRICSKIK